MRSPTTPMRCPGNLWTRALKCRASFCGGVLIRGGRHGRQTDAQGAPADARHESAGSFGFDARLIRQHHRDVVLDRIDTPASGTFQALAVGRKPDGRLTQGADKDLEQLFAHRHGNLLRANRPTVADPNCRKQLPRLTSPFVARVFRPGILPLRPFTNRASKEAGYKPLPRRNSRTTCGTSRRSPSTA